jgi:hypothetical protein
MLKRHLPRRVDPIVHLDSARIANLDRLFHSDIRADHAAERFGRYVCCQERTADVCFSTNDRETHVQTNLEVALASTKAEDKNRAT